MAVPKKKKSKSKTRSRRAAAWTITAPGMGTCARCGQPKMSHRACPSCGTYRGRQVVDA